MTTEEKAQQLISIFIPYADVDKEGDAKWYARKCAEACAQEIIKAVDDFDNELYECEGVRMKGHKEYYENVLFHIRHSEPYINPKQPPNKP